MFATLAGGRRKQRHEGVERKSIGKKGLITAMEVATRNGRSVEGKTHVGEAGANELSIDCRVMGKGRAKEYFIIIKLPSEDVL